MGPATRISVFVSHMGYLGVERTGPTKSGIQITRQITFERMKKNPSKVTMLGASHSGRSSTNAFHYNPSADFFIGVWGAYVVLEDIVRNQRFVDTRILVRLQMDESLF
jgi:hypothetical protein